MQQNSTKVVVMTYDFTRMQRLKLALLAMLCLTGIAAFAQTTTYSYTGSMQTYTVPAGVFSIRIETWGAQGQGGNGGQGGYAVGDLAVTPGQVYNIFVGGQAGYNGGGIGFANSPRNGGGGSDVRFGGTTFADRIIVAGGGGSSSGDGNYQGGIGGGGTAGPNYRGGGGGVGYAGGNGGPGAAAGGTGFTGCHAGGAGGGGFTSGGAPSCNTCYTSTCGTAGTLGTGGNGDTWETGICYNSYGGTSGGGGGYYGGGGSSTGNCGSGGGGGGSSWVGSLTNASMTAGGRSGDGQVAITVLTTAGAALNFDGIDDRVTFGTVMNATLDAATSLTVEAWVYPVDVDAFGVIAGNYSTGGGSMQFLLRRDGNTFAFYTDRGAGLSSVATPAIVAYNTWQHVAGVWNSATQTMMIYVNGVLQGTTTGVTGTSLATTINPVMLGWNSINEQMQGSVDEVRIWTRALCSSEISNNRTCEIPTNGTSLIANYHFNQGSAGLPNAGVTTLNDATSNAYNGTLQNFTLNGATSNWIAPGGVVSGSACGVFTAPSVTVNPSSQTNISCFGGSNGAASVSATGGSGFIYDWTPGNPTGDGTASVTGLAAGTYTCTVTNDCGGVGTRTFTITAPPALAASTMQGNVACFGGATGNAMVMVSGGTPGYTYSWAPSGGTAATASGLTAGTYTCTTTDANGCTLTNTFLLTQPSSALTTSSSSTSIQCNGGSATVTVTGSGGTSPYTGDGTFTVTAGTYSYTVTDFNGCTSTTSITVTEPAAISSSVTTVDVLCNGGSTGSIDLTVSGGTGPYTFDWNSGAFTTEDLSNIPAGSYVGVLTDANGCTNGGTVTINEPAVLAATVTTSTDPTTCGGTDGAIDITVTGGVTTYTFLWNNAATTEDLSAVGAGAYSCNVTDANGCTTTVGGTLNDPTPPTVTLSLAMDTLCVDDAMFALTGESPSGGTFSGPGVSGGMFDAVTAGSGTHAITYTFTDVNGCTGSSVDSIYVDLCLGTPQHISGSQFTVYPNPNNGAFTLELNVQSTVVIFDAQGKIVSAQQLAGGKHQLNIGASGMYMITVTTADGQRTSQKVIVQE